MIRLALVGALASAGALHLAGCGDSVAPLPREGVPDSLEFVFGGFAMETNRWALRGDTLVFLRVPAGFDGSSGVDTVRRVPAAEEWRAFWAAAADAGVGRWRARYEAEGVVDGNGWSLRLVAGELRVDSEGSNAYPERDGDERELEPTDAFRDFRSALEAFADPS